jgi:hypothetical protein
MTTRITMRSLSIALFAALGVATTSETTLACGDGWFPEIRVDYRVEGIASAEKDLANGRTLAAAGKVIRMIPHIKGYEGASKDAIVNRSMRVLAVAVARHDGNLSALADELPDELREEFAGTSADAKRANVAWSVKALRSLKKQKKDDVTLKTELAEALAALPESQPKARKMLEKLARKDLLTTPEAYRALSRLRAAAGDSNGEAAARARCRAMASDAHLCDARPAAAGES